MNLYRAIAGVLSTHSGRSTKRIFSLGSSFTAQQLAFLSSSTPKITSKTITSPKPEASSPGLSSSPATEATAPPEITSKTITSPKPEASSPGLSSSPATEATAPPKITSKTITSPKPEASSPGLSSSSATEATAPHSLENYKKSSDLPRPNEIPFQPQIANQVHLVGYVGVPVELQMSPNRSCVAFSVLTSKKIEGLLSFWIPVIFQGDLAQIAACHLKENDLIYVTGQLSGNTASVAQEVSCTNIQVLADKLSFVHDGYLQPTPSFKAIASKADSCKSWDDLLLNPHDWFDYREAKLNELIKPKHPDFKNQKTNEALWLDRAPSWVLKRLQGLVFASTVNKKLPPQESSEYLGEAGKSIKKKYTYASSIKNNEKSWTNLIDNPKDWWDNRSTKPKTTFPDFKHKETGEPLWLSSSTPDWVLSKLPPVGTAS